MQTAFPSTIGTCKITLYSNIPFDNSYANHTIISTRFHYGVTSIYTGSSSYGVPKERFINRRSSGVIYSYPRYELTGDFNFNFSNGLVASVTLELTDVQTNANYMKLVCADTSVYYYFITGIKQDNFQTYTLSLELDVLMTYQDEFLSGMRYHPAFTQRKHCHRYTNDGLYPHCADFKTGDSAFAGVKPNKVIDVKNLTLSGIPSYARDITWLYICADDDYVHKVLSDPTDADYATWQFFRYKYKSTAMPLMMLCVPLNIAGNFIITNGTDTVSITHNNILKLLHSLVGSGNLHGAKISKYPPFQLNTGDTLTADGSGNFTLTTTNAHFTKDPNDRYVYTNNKGSLCAIASGRYFMIINELDSDYDYNNVTLSFKNTTYPEIGDKRYLEPKLLFNPFRKYYICATYGNGNEFFPELIYSDGVYSSQTFKFANVYNFFIGDNSYFTYQKYLTDGNSVSFYSNYKPNNIGLSSSVNHTMPVGTDALDVFNATQANSFYTSKVASGITSGLSVAGGVGSIIIGSGMTVGSSGALSPMGMGMIAGGATAIASGVAGMATSIKSTNAKIEDLKNTPDAINTQGSSFVGDFSRGNVMPFITIYDVSDVIKQQASDYFYNYGYEVSRECYFNADLSYDNDVSNTTDNNLFGRTIFNYIQLREDITNKIDADIPYIIKKKISSIFNQGITIWNFFGFQELWGSQTAPSDDEYNLNRYFLKCEYDNTEYLGDTY